MLIFLISCMSDHVLTNKIVEERIIYDTAYVEVIIEVEKEVEVEVPENYPLGLKRTYNHQLVMVLIFCGLLTLQAR